MSVIYGLCRFNGIPINPAELSQMESALNHWGADKKTTWHDASAALGHLMLYNTPQSLTETLPYVKNDSGLAITADACIYNREDIYATLSIPVATGNGIPDSILILLLYEKFTHKCINHLIGDFAFAIWDSKKQELFCARDQMGVRPFVYYQDDHLFAFATEKKGIFALPGIDKTIDEQYLYNQLMWPPRQSVDTTLYKKIKRLPPAHTLTLSLARKSFRLQRYWDLDADTESRLSSDADYAEGLRHYFEQAVQCRLRSSYTIGTELSGGLDSSAITGIAQTLLKKEQREIVTFSNIMPDKANTAQTNAVDERQYIDAVIGFNNISKFVYVTQNIFADPIAESDFAIRVNDGLEYWNPLWQISSKKAAMQENVRTLFSGFPGDEMVTYLGQDFLLDFLDKKQYKKYWGTRSGGLTFNKLLPFVPNPLVYGWHKLKNIKNANDQAIKTASEIFNIPLKYKLNRNDTLFDDACFKDRFKSFRHFQKYRLLNAHVPLRMESESRYGIYFKTEPRFPLADIRLTQFYLSMPDHLKYEGNISRSFFRKAMQQYLPEAVLNRDSKFGAIAPFMSVKNYDTPQFQRDTAAIIRNIRQKPNVKKYILASPDKAGVNPYVFLDVLRWLEQQ